MKIPRSFFPAMKLSQRQAYMLLTLAIIIFGILGSSLWVLASSSQLRAFSSCSAPTPAVADTPPATPISTETVTPSPSLVDTSTPIVTPASGRCTFTPKQLTPDIEVGNPERSAQYYGSEAPPANWPLTDRYDRWCWNAIEPQTGQYNFSLIDHKLAEAAAAGYSFGFRIMPATSTPCLPPGLSLDYGPQYMQRAQALFTALGKHYNNDPRLGWLDMSLYGCYGEWNQAQSGCKAVASPQIRKQLIDMQVQAFSNKRFLMLTGAQDSLDYALKLRRSEPIGVRIDCLGQQGLGGALNILKNDVLVRDRWRVAPLYFEYCSKPDFQQALSDIETFHASIIGDGANHINDYNSYNQQDQMLLKENYLISGYRYVLNTLSIPDHPQAGQNFTVESLWSNLGVAPTYHAWQVMIQLRDASGKVAWQGMSSLDLRQQLPTLDMTTGKDHPVSVSDQFTLPATLPTGNYMVSVQILDPDHYYHPLKLAIDNVQSDGSYLIGTMAVNGSASISPTSASSTLTPASSATPTSPTTNASISQYIWGENLSLNDANDFFLTNQATQQLMSTLHVQLVRFPDRHDLNVTTAAAKEIKVLGLTPLLILHYGTQSVQEDQQLIQMMNTVFGNTATVYYEYGNEVDLAQGVDQVAYTTSWNAVIPQLKTLAPHGVFIGPVNFQINVPYLAYFVQHASPAPDAVSWHEYTCNVKVDNATCIAKIDNWSKHIAAARAAIGSKLPILITEYNWNPNPEKEHDTRGTDNAFLQQWQSHAIQVLIENHVFAACHYTWSNQPALAIINDTTHQPTGAGLAFQHTYEQDITNATSAATATSTTTATATPEVTSTPVPTDTATSTIATTPTPVPTDTVTASTNELLTEVNAVNLAIAKKGKLHITTPVVGDVLLVYVDATGGIQAVTQVSSTNHNQLVTLSADQFATLFKVSQS